MTAPLTATDDANLNGKAMTTATGASITQALITATTGTLTPAGTLTINSNVTYAGAATTGMVIVGSGASLTINGQVTQSAATGYAIVASSTGVVTISNAGGTAISNTNSGRGVSHGSTGNLSVTGDVANSGDGRAIYISAVATVSIVGDVSNTGGGNCVESHISYVEPAITGDVHASAGNGVYCFPGRAIVDGNLTSSVGGNAVNVNNGGKLTWSGNRTLASNEECRIVVTSAGVVDFSSLVLTNSGRWLLDWRGTGTPVFGSGGTLCQIINHISTSESLIIGTDHAGVVIGPTLPAVDEVEDGVLYGYGDSLEGEMPAGGGVDPADIVAAANVRNGTPRYTGGSNGTAYIPAAADVRYGANVDATTGTCHVPTAAQTQSGVAVDVSDTGTFTHTEDYTLTASIDYPAVGNVLSSDTVGGSSGTYHAPDAAEVISTASFGANSGTAGTYSVTNVAAGNIKKNVSIGGVTGTYDPMAAAVFPAEADVNSTDTAYGPTGAEYAGSLNMGLYTLITNVVSATYVVTGHDNYTGGTSGSYPTTATTTASVQASDAATLTATTLDTDGTDTTVAFGASNGTAKSGAVYSAGSAAGYEAGSAAGFTAGQADQLDTDKDAVTAGAASILDSATILTIQGTYDLATEQAAQFASGQADQLATDQAAVLSSAEWIISGHSILSQSGAFDLSAYTLTSSIDYPAATSVLSSDTVGGTPGTYHEAESSEVKSGVTYGPSSSYTGTYAGGTVEVGILLVGVAT